MTSAFGLMATTAYQVVYTRPRWNELVADRMAARNLQAQDVLQLFAIFGGQRWLHSYPLDKLLIDGVRWVTQLAGYILNVSVGLAAVLVTVHTMIQARVLAKSGAMALGIVNA